MDEKNNYDVIKNLIRICLSALENNTNTPVEKAINSFKIFLNRWRRRSPAGPPESKIKKY